MIKKGTRLSLFLTAVLGFLSISVGHAAFQTGENGATDSYDGTITLRKPVCYISGSPNVYYPSIEKALKVAENTTGSQTVYVIPGANPTIQSNCTIASGDSLILPYADDGTTHTYHDYLSQSPTLAYKSGTLVTKVTIADGFTLTNNGTLTIGAIQNSGSGGNLYSGNATKSYTEIFLEGAAKVVNAGTMNAYGYIASDPANTTASVVMNSGSKTYAPFTVMEHRGGQIFTGMSSSNVTALLASAVLGGATADLTCFPFNRMFVDCFLDVNYSFAKGSYLYGLAALYADSQTNTTNMNLIGDSSSFLFNLSSNAIFTGRFVTAEEKHKVETFGSFALQSMSLDLAVSSGGISGKIKLSSGDVLLPVSHYYDFTLSPFEDGAAAKVNTTAQGIKLLPGSRVEIGANVTLNASSIAVYRNDDLYPNGKYIADTSIGTSFYPSKNDAQFVVNGILQATNCGGFVSTEGSGAQTVISSSTTVNSPEIVSTEPASVTISIVNKTINYRKPAYSTVSKNASGNCVDRHFLASSDTEYGYSNHGEKTLSAGTTYTSLFMSSDYVWNYSGVTDTIYGIRYSLGISSASMPTGYVDSFASYVSNVTLTPPESSDSRYEFEGLYYDAACTSDNKLFVSGTNPVLNVAKAMALLNGNNYITLYAKWIDTTLKNYRLITSYQTSTDHVNLTTETSETPGIVSEGFTLSGSISNMLLVSVTSTTEGTGTLTRYVFDGYSVVITDSSSTQKQTIRVQANGSDSNGYFSGFTMDGTTADALLANGDIVTATAEYTKVTIPYDFNVDFGNTTLEGKATTVASINVSANSSAVDAFSEAGLSFVSQWASPNSKLTISDTASFSPTLKNTYFPGLRSTSATITCTISAGDFLLGYFQQTYTLKRV